VRILGRIVLWGLPALLVLYLIGGSWFVYRILDRLLVVGNVADIASEGQPADSPYELAYRGDPQAAFELPFETVQVPTPLGDAEAWFIPAPGGKSTWAVFVHGIAGVREGGYRYVPELHAAGFPVLMISYRNDAAAPKSAEGIYAMGLTEWPDVDAAISHALESGAADILLIGDSMGGALVGQFLTHSAQTGNLAGVILDSPALDYPMVVEALVRHIGLPLAPALSAIATSAFSMTHGVRLWDAASIERVAAFPGPMLVVHGTGDRLVPIEITDKLVAVRQGTTTRLRTRADHLQSRQEDPALYDWTLKSFLASLGSAP
jgi:pimeloyl-ACP methyl ester carboxylesterase